MIETRKCSFCGRDIAPGTGKMYVKKDGTVYYFDTNRCYKNMIELKRVPRTTKWTQKAHDEKDDRQRNEKAKTVTEVPVAPVAEAAPAEASAQE